MILFILDDIAVLFTRNTKYVLTTFRNQMNVTAKSKICAFIHFVPVMHPISGQIIRNQ